MVPTGLVAILMARCKLDHGLPWFSYPISVAAGFLVGEPRILRDFPEVFHAVQWVGSLNRNGMPYHVARPPAWIDYPVNVMPFAMTLPMLLVTAIAVAWVALRGGRRFLPIWTMLACYFPLMAMDNWRVVRYTVPLLPFAALFVAVLVSRLLDFRRLRGLVMVAIYALVAYTFLFSFSYVQVMAQSDPRIQASVWMEENLPRDKPVPTIFSHHTNGPDLKFMRYTKIEVHLSIPQLRDATSPYLIVSEFGTRFYEEAISHYPQQQKFLEYVQANYQEVSRFENSQKFLGIDSKRDGKLPADWLRPNPRITIYRRLPGGGAGNQTANSLVVWFFPLTGPV